MCVWMWPHLCRCVWKPRKNVRGPALSLSYCLEMGSSLNPGARFVSSKHQVSFFFLSPTQCRGYRPVPGYPWLCVCPGLHTCLARAPPHWVVVALFLLFKSLRSRIALNLFCMGGRSWTWHLSAPISYVAIKLATGLPDLTALFFLLSQLWVSQLIAGPLPAH